MYLMDKLKRKFESEDHEINPQELNYKVGNTSGLDVTGQIPSDIAERVGQLAQRGGGEMEIQVENPTSYHINREELYHTIQDLGLDVSFHADPNVGFTSMYKTGQGRGFDVTHNYFTNYLQEFASFKKEKEGRDDIDFRISRINPHISTDEEPPLQERMAQDVGLDPFGFPISEYNDEFREMRDQVGKNIFRNEDFLQNFYKAFILSEVDDEYQIYGLFQRFSPKFRRQWRLAQAEAIDDFWKNIEGLNAVDPQDERLEKAALLQSIRMQDQGTDLKWKELVEEHDKLQMDEPITILRPSRSPIGGLTFEEETVENLPEIEDIVLGQRRGGLGTIGNFVYELENEQVYDKEELRSQVETLDDEEQIEEYKQIVDQMPDPDKFAEIALGLIDDAMDILWIGNGKGNKFRISVDAKKGVLQSRLDLEQTQILERAQEKEPDDYSLEEHAIRLVRGNEDYFEPEGAEEKGPKEKHQDLLKQLINSFEQALWMESNLFHKIIPAWMSASDNEFTKGEDVVHEAFEAPEFIWDVIVERNHEDVNFDNDYVRRLERDEEFKKDVSAASAAVVVWSHFTQIESNFKVDSNQYIEEDYRECTWIDWMNDHGIGVNMEAMNGSANSHFKLWRPKDIVTACRAVNITARNELDDIHENLYDCPMKFTIDMEHTASFGVDPWKQMEELIEQEKWLADNNEKNVPVDKQRPLAKMVRMYHLTKPGHETSQGTGHIHGPFRHGDIQLYTWLHDMVKNGFTQSDERASVMYEVGGEMTGTVQKAKLSMNMIELGIEPDKVDPARVDPGKDYETEEEALIARFFGMDRPSFNREWSKIEQHAFDPLEGVLEATNFNHTWTSTAAIKNDNRPQEYQQEEYR